MLIRFRRNLNYKRKDLYNLGNSCNWYDNSGVSFMDIIIQSLGFKASNHLEDYIREKLSKLKPNDNIVRANVVLFQGPDKAVQNDYCEIRLEVPGNDHFVKESSPDFEQSIDNAVDILQGILRKNNEKMRDRQQKGSSINEAL